MAGAVVTMLVLVAGMAVRVVEVVMEEDGALRYCSVLVMGRGAVLHVAAAAVVVEAVVVCSVREMATKKRERNKSH